MIICRLRKRNRERDFVSILLALPACTNNTAFRYMMHKRVCESEAGRATNSTTPKKPRVAHGGIDSSRPTTQVQVSVPSARDKRSLENPSFVPNAIAPVREHKRPRSSSVLNGLVKESYTRLAEPSVLSRLDGARLSGTAKRSHLSSGDDSTARSCFVETSAGRSGSSSPHRANRLLDPIDSVHTSLGGSTQNTSSVAECALDDGATCPTAGIDGPLVGTVAGTVDNQPSHVYERSLCSLFVQDLLISTLLDDEGEC